MSIYRSGRAYTLDVQRDVRQPELPSSELQRIPTADTEAGFLKMRRARPAETVLPRTQAWFEALPEFVRPHQLMAQFARIANVLALCWAQPHECFDELEKLLTDSRGGRRGFPPEVQRELVALRSWRYGVREGRDGRWYG